VEDDDLPSGIEQWSTTGGHRHALRVGDHLTTSLG
jgi:hypothetical protein